MSAKWASLLLAGALLLQGFGCVREVPPVNARTVKLTIPNLMGG